MLSGAISAVLAWFWQQLRVLKRGFAGLITSTKANNSDRIVQKCVYHLRMGYIPMQDRMILMDMYEAHCAIGGNKSLGDLVAQARALPNEKQEG